MRYENKDTAISILDTKKLLQSERILNKNTDHVAFAFGHSKELDELDEHDRENYFRALDNLPPLPRPVKLADKVSRSTSNNTRRYI